MSEADPDGKKRAKLPSFWIPSLTPQTKEADIKKPDSKTYCPMSGKPLRVKDLIDVKFTIISDIASDRKGLISKEARYKCPVTGDVLGNSVPSAVLRPRCVTCVS